MVFYQLNFKLISSLYYMLGRKLGTNFDRMGYKLGTTPMTMGSKMKHMKPMTPIQPESDKPMYSDLEKRKMNQ
jgi:hypothetical protein